MKTCSGGMRSLQQVEEHIFQAGGDGPDAVDRSGVRLSGSHQALHDGLGAAGGNPQMQAIAEGMRVLNLWIGAGKLLEQAAGMAV